LTLPLQRKRQSLVRDICGLSISNFVALYTTYSLSHIYPTIRANTTYFWFFNTNEAAQQGNNPFLGSCLLYQSLLFYVTIFLILSYLVRLLFLVYIIFTSLLEAVLCCFFNDKVSYVSLTKVEFNLLFYVLFIVISCCCVFKI